MSTVNLTLGGKNKIATVTVLDTNGNVVPKSQYNLTPLIDTPNIVGESATTYGDGQFGAVGIGSAGVKWTAQLTSAAGGGPVVESPVDTLVVGRAPIGSVTVVYTDSPV